MVETVNIKELNPDTFEFQDYSSKDSNLIPSLEVSSVFNPSTDYLEFFVLDLNNSILFSNTSGYPNYILLDNNLSINPESDLKASGFEEGTYNTYYNVLSNKLSSNSFTKYYISELSSDRTEVRLSSTSITDEEIISSTNDFINQSSELNSYPDFYLNFDNNQLVIANNIELDGNTILIKLYEPLPSSFGLKSELWVVEKIAEPKAFNISITQVFSDVDTNIQLQGPNLNLDVKDNINNSTEYKSFDSLTTSTTSQGSGSFLYQINNKLKQSGLVINIDYTDYSNFIHFSSAKTRLENFYYKLSLIEEYTVSASYSDSASSGSYYVSSSNNIWQVKINEIIEGFDGYDYHLYYNSGSTSWPKTGATPPYTNEPTDNPGTGYSWFVTQSLVAENYDLENDNALINTVPEYLREDPNNANYELFVEMIGQQFDNIYLYLKDVTNKFNADNRLDYGISKDLVADAIKDLGVKIYQNNFSKEDVYTALIGIDPSGSLFGLPNTSETLPSPAGYEYINTYITASDTSSLYPIDDINKSIYKRIYHNLPYLLKKKGTVEGLKALITTFGIPNTILRVNEFGGKDKDSNTWDQWQNEYDYTFTTSGSGFVDIPWDGSPLLDVYGGAAAAYSLRQLDSDYNGVAIIVRRDSDDVEKEIKFLPNGYLDTETLLNFVNTDYITYTSIFSAGGNVFGDSSNISQSLGQSIGGEDNTLQVNLSGSGNSYYVYKGPLNVGANYRITGKFYIPSSNAKVDAIRIANDNSNPQDYSGSLDQWVDFEFTSVATVTYVIFRAYDGASSVVDADGDVFYLKDLQYTQIGGNGYVTTWFDQSGNGNNAEQPSATKQPKIVSGGTTVTEGGKPAMLLDGTNDIFTINSIPQTSSFSHFTVQSGSGFSYGGSGDIFRFTSGEYVRLSIDNNPLQFNTGSAGEHSVTSFIRNSSDDVEIFYQGSSAKTGNLSGGFSSDFLLGYAGIIFWDGKFQEHIIYSADQTSNQSDISENINYYYSIY